MKQHTASRLWGFSIAALACLFTLTMTQQAEAKESCAKGILRVHGISMSVVRLDRVDGFTFGFSFKGRGRPPVVVAPGPGRMLLVQCNGSETVVQPDARGQLQIIQADGDIAMALCVLQQVFAMVNNILVCDTPVCILSAVITMINDIVACTEPAA